MDATPHDAVPPEEDAACIHHWVLANPVEGETQGTCRLCGVVRTFTNTRRKWSRGRPYQPRNPTPPPG